MPLNDWNHFIRPNLWAFGIAIFLIGVLASGSYLLGTYMVGVIVSILLCTASITVNHYFDFETDRKSRQLYRFPVAAGKISKSTAACFSVVVILVSVALSYLFLDILSLYLVVFANFMVYAYSARPFRIKEKPYLETFWNAVGYGWVPYYLALFISGVAITTNHHILGFVPFFISASGHILLQVRDIEDDRKGSVITTSTRHGMQPMKKASQLMIGLAGLSIVYLAATFFLNYFAWLAIACGALVFLEHRRMKNDVEKSYRKLQIVYMIGGLFFILSLFRF